MGDGALCYGALEIVGLLLLLFKIASNRNKRSTLRRIVSCQNQICMIFGKPNFGLVSVFKKERNRSQKVKPEISVSMASLKTELVSYK